MARQAQPTLAFLIRSVVRELRADLRLASRDREAGGLRHVGSEHGELGHPRRRQSDGDRHSLGGTVDRRRVVRHDDGQSLPVKQNRRVRRAPHLELVEPSLQPDVPVALGNAPLDRAGATGVEAEERGADGGAREAQPAARSEPAAGDLEIELEVARAAQLDPGEALQVGREETEARRLGSQLEVAARCRQKVRDRGLADRHFVQFESRVQGEGVRRQAIAGEQPRLLEIELREVESHRPTHLEGGQAAHRARALERELIDPQPRQFVELEPRQRDAPAGSAVLRARRIGRRGGVDLDRGAPRAARQQAEVAAGKSRQPDQEPRGVHLGSPARPPRGPPDVEITHVHEAGDERPGAAPAHRELLGPSVELPLSPVAVQEDVRAGHVDELQPHQRQDGNAHPALEAGTRGHTSS